jgi:thiamine pyrophosphokinase
MEAMVFAGGDALHASWRPLLPIGAVLIAADSGLEHIDALGLKADYVVGDMDSVPPPLLERAVANGTQVERHPALKDATDLALALATAQRLGAETVTIIGAGGGRLDHFIANALLLASPEWEGLRIQALVGPARVVVVRPDAELRGRAGSVVTLLALHGTARGVSTSGLRWMLSNDELHPGSTRGVSNEMTESRARVTVREGVLLAIQPTGGS